MILKLPFLEAAKYLKALVTCTCDNTCRGSEQLPTISEPLTAPKKPGNRNLGAMEASGFSKATDVSLYHRRDMPALSKLTLG